MKQTCACHRNPVSPSVAAIRNRLRVPSLGLDPQGSTEWGTVLEQGLVRDGPLRRPVCHDLVMHKPERGAAHQEGEHDRGGQGDDDGGGRNAVRERVDGLRESLCPHGGT